MSPSFASPRLSLARQAVLPALAVGLTALLAPSANAQANLTFSGGSGTPLTLTLAAPITYTVIQADPNNPIVFLFKGVGNPTNSTFFPVTSTITFRVNNGAAQTITNLRSGFSGGVLAANDLFIFGTYAGINVNDIVTLTAGTVTTNGNVAAAAPAAGSFTTFLTSNSAARLSNDGVAITAAPEPASLALISVGFVGCTLAPGMVGMIARRKACA